MDFHVFGFSSQMLEDAVRFHLSQGQAIFASNLRNAQDFWAKASLLNLAVRCGWQVA